MIGHIEVDQSGKIEFTGTDTVLAFADGISYSVLVPARVKREALSMLRARWRPAQSKKTIILRLFAAILYLLLRDHLDRMGRIVIDVEYKGHERDIRGQLLLLIHRDHPRQARAPVTFHEVGKHSAAHRLAWEVHRGKRKADHYVTIAELAEVL